MIDIAALNQELVRQDDALRAAMSAATASISDDSLRAIADLIANGLAAIHERQGNLIVLTLQSTS
jgi:hypothetical protein